jgi:L-amino acid N-acyltransferase YncA
MKHVTPSPRNPQAHYTVRWVFGQLPAARRQAIVAFWLREGAIQCAEEAWRRAWEVACVLEEAGTGAVAGVCTVAVGFDDAQRSFGYVRIYIGKRHRHPGLAVRMIQRMLEGFEVLAYEPGAPYRLLAGIENPKLEARAGQRLLAGLGFTVIGKTAEGGMLLERVLESHPDRIEVA